jgi:hypothetical protein
MDRNTITTIAKSIVPFVREVVSDAVTPLAARLADLEARPVEKGERGSDGSTGPEGAPGPKGDSGELAVLPPELADQVASAIRLLHESPPMEKRDSGNS